MTLPNLILLGQPKAGTTALHTRIYKHSPLKPCCTKKEPFTLIPSLRGRNFRQERNSAPFVMDFTPNYLANAETTIAEIKNMYTDAQIRNLTMVYVYRNATARALSHYCMFSPSKDSVARLCKSTKNTTLKTICNKSRDEARLRLLRDAFYPYVDQHCATGWGWYRHAHSFSEAVNFTRDQMYHGWCNTTPAKVLAMNLTSLRQFSWQCMRDRTMLNYFVESAPLPQLRRYLLEFPHTRFIFLRYETLFSTQNELFDLMKMSYRQCRSVSGMKFVHARDSVAPFPDVDRVFAPWSRAMESVITEYKRQRA